MRKLLPISLIATFLFTSCISDLFRERDKRIKSLPRGLTAAEQQVIDADMDFGIDLFQNLSREEQGNMFISPLSVSMALGMTVNGAAGDTRTGMKEALRKSDMDMDQINESYRGLVDMLTGLDPAIEMKIANAIWYRPDYALRDKFMTDVRQYFDAEVRGLDFSNPATVDIINGWVNEKTEGLIPEIVESPIPPFIITYLMNALYFKGEWFTPFDPGLTKPASFNTPDGEVEVDMMKHSKEILAFHESPGVRMVDLAYGDSLFSMTLLMPEDPEQSLDEFIGENLTRENLESWINGLQPSSPITVKIPKFELEYSANLEKVLSAMGMKKAFMLNADFTNMYEEDNAHIDSVAHKTAIRVDERGTEAAAVTNVPMAISGAPTFEFDRPFIYLIRERLSGSLIFMGKMIDPTAE